jgi:hypothetical protein
VERTPSITRRSVMATGVLVSALTALETTGALSIIPKRAGASAGVGNATDDAGTLVTPSDIQFDIGAFTAPPTTVNGIQVAFPPVHTLYVTAALSRKPSIADQNEMKRVLAQLEASYAWSAAQLITHVAYGGPYWNRINPLISTAAVPRTLADRNRFALREAVPTGTDVVSGNGITKLRFQVPVRIERNDVLFTLRGDNFATLQDVLNWFNGSNRLRGAAVTSPRWRGFLTINSVRHMFVQRGLPRQVAQQNGLTFARFIQPDAPMWMGFADQQTNAAGPPPIVTFAGNASARLTDAAPGRYLDNGSIQHLSHDIIDMLQWFDMESPGATPEDDGVFLERVQYMFHSPAIHPGNADQLTNGGGPSFLPTQNRGPNYARQTAQGIGTDIDPETGQGERRIGHLSALQRSSRAADGTPLHIRIDGPGFDNMDVPGGANQPKLEFSAFFPTADFFATMRANTAAQDLVRQFDIEGDENGLERFITATRRQNFLIPPRRNRAFPLIEIFGA